MADRLAAPPSSPGSIEGGLLPSYAEFAANEEAADAMDRDSEWGAGPVRFLFAGRSEIDAGEDGVSRATDLLPRSGGVVGLRDREQGRANRIEPDSFRLGSGQKKGSREVWYYRADRLPKELPFRELRFEFQTRGGYGIGVLQKDAVNLSVLSKMADLIARPR